MPQDDGRMAASSSDASSAYPPPRFDEHAGDRLILPLQQQQQQQRSRPIAIIRRKSSDFHDDDDDSSDDAELPDQTTRTSRITTPTTTTFQTHHPHHQSMPTNPALLLRAPLLSSIPTRYDQEDLIPAFRLSDNTEEPDPDDDRPFGPFNSIITTSTSTQPLAYGSLRESQIQQQQQQQFLRTDSGGKPHSFIRKRGGVRPPPSDHINNNNNAMMTASSAPIRSTLLTTTTITNTTTTTNITTTSGLTIGERIQQQRKLQLALLSNQNNTNTSSTSNINSNSTSNQTGAMVSTGDYSSTINSSSSGLPSLPSTTQPKRTSSILAAMLLLDQPAPLPSLPNNNNNNNHTTATPSLTNFTEDDRPFWSTEHPHHHRHDTTGVNSSSSRTQPLLSTSYTGLDILQQQGRRPWSTEPATTTTTVPQMSRSHSQPGFITSASVLEHHGAFDPAHFSLPPTAPYFAATTTSTTIAHFTATSWHDRPHQAVATGLEHITTNHPRNDNIDDDDDDDFLDENGDMEEEDDDIVEAFDLDME